MDIFDRLFGRPHKSASVAKQRLQFVLTQDRTNISPETLNLLKDEIVGVISKYIEIDAANVAVAISSDKQGHRLTADIPVVGSRKPRPPGRTERKSD